VENDSSDFWVWYQSIKRRYQTAKPLASINPLHLTYLTLPYLQGGQAAIPAQRWGCISLAQCASLDVTIRLQETTVKPKSVQKPKVNQCTSTGKPIAQFVAKCCKQSTVCFTWWHTMYSILHNHLLYVVAFVKGDYPHKFPGLEVRYVRGSDPFIKLLNEQRVVVETLSIDKWDTDTIVEFLTERLEK